MEDFRAQAATTMVGVRRVRALVGKYGLDVFRECTRMLIDYSEEKVRRFIKNLPDGDYTGMDYLDDELLGLMKEAGHRPGETGDRRGGGARLAGIRTANPGHRLSRSALRSRSARARVCGPRNPRLAGSGLLDLCRSRPGAGRAGGAGNLVPVPRNDRRRRALPAISTHLSP